MNRRDRETLEYLLHELITTQDSATHLNSKGSKYEQSTRLAIAKRDYAKRKIIAFCEARIE